MTRVAAAIPSIALANPMANAKSCLELISKAHSLEVDVICFPMLALTGCTVGDLFYSDFLIDETAKALEWLVQETCGLEPLAVVGLTLKRKEKLYNAVAYIKNGNLLGYKADPNPEDRHFASPWPRYDTCWKDSIAQNESGIDVSLYVAFASEIAEGVEYEGIVLSPQAIPAKVGVWDEVSSAIESYSRANKCALVLASAGNGESSTDKWYPGFAAVVECGKALKFESPFCGLSYVSLNYDSVSDDVIQTDEPTDSYTLSVESDPFMCGDPIRKAQEAFAIQCGALRSRMEHIGVNKLVIGVSGGLDSTLALLVCVRTLDAMGLDRKNLIGVTMPGFGTTDRTYHNAVSMMQTLGIEWREINIKEACLLHLRDIGHDIDVHNSAYENAQARERTQILMDVANEEGALVIGTGDLSELALGWCTYNGDHMSMYAVNGSVPKTAIHYIIRYVATKELEKEVRPFLYDVIKTPISPELLPGGVSSQKTEDLIGPYKLHDFFIWHFVGQKCTPREIYELAKVAFNSQYEADEIKHWLELFIKRFFSQQFKRSCLPDGPDVFGISLSPRSGFCFPSDVSGLPWTEDLNL